MTLKFERNFDEKLSIVVKPRCLQMLNVEERIGGADSNEIIKLIQY